MAKFCGLTADATLAGEVELLKVVSAQDVEDDGEGGVRIALAVAPERVVSVVDPEARHGHRSRRDRYDGYKLPVSVDITSDLFVAGAASKATAGDASVLPALLAADPMAVAEVIGDTHYGGTATRRSLASQGIELRRPRPTGVGPQGSFQQGRLRGGPRRRHGHLPGGPGRRHRRQGSPARSPLRCPNLPGLPTRLPLHQTPRRARGDRQYRRRLARPGPPSPLERAVPPALPPARPSRAQERPAQVPQHQAALAGGGQSGRLDKTAHGRPQLGPSRPNAWDHLLSLRLERQTSA